MEESESLREACLAAAGLILEPPGEKVGKLVCGFIGKSCELEVLKREYFSLFAFPGSADYCPPFEHVLQQAELQDGEWTFPGPRQEGGDPLRDEFEEIGFDWERYTANQPTVGGRFSPDHLGLILLCLAAILGSGGREEPARAFARKHLAAIRKFGQMVAAKQGLYAKAVTVAFSDVILLAGKFLQGK